MYDYHFLSLQSPDQTSDHTKWAVSLVIAYGHFNLPQGFVGVTYSLYHPRGSIHVQRMKMIHIFMRNQGKESQR